MSHNYIRDGDHFETVRSNRI